MELWRRVRRTQQLPRCKITRAQAKWSIEEGRNEEDLPVFLVLKMTGVCDTLPCITETSLAWNAGNLMEDSYF